MAFGDLGVLHGDDDLLASGGIDAEDGKTGVCLCKDVLPEQELVVLGRFHARMGALDDRPSVAVETVDEHLIVAFLTVGIVMITIAVTVECHLLADVEAVIMTELIRYFVNLRVFDFVITANVKLIDDIVYGTFGGLVGAKVDVSFLMHNEERRTTSPVGREFKRLAWVAVKVGTAIRGIP